MKAFIYATAIKNKNCIEIFARFACYVYKTYVLLKALTQLYLIKYFIRKLKFQTSEFTFGFELFGDVLLDERMRLNIQKERDYIIMAY